MAEASEKAVERALPAPVVPRPAMALTQARCGEPLRIVGLRPGSAACMRLREMGFCESAEVCKVVDGTALICVLQGVRMAIGRNLGADVLVERISPAETIC